jgi:hypothetical protein
MYIQILKHLNGVFVEAITASSRTTTFVRICARHPLRMQKLSRARICRPFKEPRNRFPACRDGTKTLFVVLARQAPWGGEIDSSESIPELRICLQIRARDDEVMTSTSSSIFVFPSLFIHSDKYETCSATPAM